MNSNELQSHQPVVQTIPDDLKLLVRIIMRTFYGFELYLSMEMLMLYPCIKEEDLADLLRLDLKVMQQHLKNLKKEKFLSEKSLMETTQDGAKQIKQNYYYINYKMMVNVVKYKLDKIRQQIEIQDKQFTTRAQFKCTQCHKTYNDLDTKDIFLTMRCIYCGGDIDEDAGSMPSRSNRNLIHTFNTQMRPIFELLSKVENVRLADHLLRPEICDMTYILERIRSLNAPASASQNGAGKAGEKASNGLNNGMGGGGRAHMIKYEKWSGDKTRNLDLLSQTKVQINIDSSADGTSATAQRKPKELPSILLLNRTSDEDSSLSSKDNRDSILLESVRQAADETIQNQQSLESSPKQQLQQQQQQQQQQQREAALTESTNLHVQNGAPKAISTGVSTNLAADENSIMQLLLKFEKKSLYDQAAKDQQKEPINVSSLNTSTTQKKRPFLNGQSVADLSSSTSDLSFSKKRRLNDGDAFEQEKPYKNVHKNGSFNSHKNVYSDGSENSDEYDYEEDESHYINREEAYDQSETLIPHVFFKNRSIPFDKITPKHINQMNDYEKEDYINICRQLYAEVYEI